MASELKLDEKAMARRLQVKIRMEEIDPELAY